MREFRILYLKILESTYDQRDTFLISAFPRLIIVLELLENFRRSKIMFAAVKLGVFDALQERPQSSRDLAAKLNCNDEAMERLLNACVGLQLLIKQR